MCDFWEGSHLQIFIVGNIFYPKNTKNIYLWKTKTDYSNPILIKYVCNLITALFSKL